MHQVLSGGAGGAASGGAEPAHLHERPSFVGLSTGPRTPPTPVRLPKMMDLNGDDTYHPDDPKNGIIK